MSIVNASQRWIRQVNESWRLSKRGKLKWALSSDVITPVFIVSSGRSGTTLLRKKIVNADNIHIPPESDDLIPYNASRYILHNSRGWEFLVEDVLQNFKNAPCFIYWAIDLDALHKTLISLPPAQRTFADIIHQIYMYHGQHFKSSVKIWGDKTPYLIYRLKWIRAVFPKARYIHLVRDGRAAVHSMMNKQNYDLKTAATRWRDSIRLFDGHQMHIPKDQAMEIKYETLVTYPADTLRNVFRFLEIPFSDSLLADRNQALGDDVLPHHNNLSKPITGEFVDLWKHELTKDQIELVNRLLRAELKSRNYPV